MDRPLRLAGLAFLVSLLVGPSSAIAQDDGAERTKTSPPSHAPSAAHGDFAGRIEIRGGRKLYLECRGSGRPTVMLESGLGNAADVWGDAFLAASEIRAAAGGPSGRRTVYPCVRLRPPWDGPAGSADRSVQAEPQRSRRDAPDRARHRSRSARAPA